MSTAGISFSGLGSGLDTQSIISALLAVERRPITALNQKKESFKTQKGLFGDLDEKLDALRDLADDLRLSVGFLDYSAAVDRENSLTATASKNASEGAHTIEVVNLATAQVSHTSGKADKDVTTYGSGTLEITIDGVATFVEIDGTNNTLEGIAGAISSAGIDIRAQALDTGSGATPFELVVTSTKTGLKGAFSIALDTGSAELQNLVNELGGSPQPVAAADAEFKLDGITVFRSSNTIGDAIPGVTLNLTGEDVAGYTTNLTISTNTTTTADKVEEFIDAYNEVVDFVSGQGQLDEDGNPNNPLFGDSMLRSVRSSLRSIVGSTFDTGNTAYSMFVQIGINSDKDGRLTLNRGAFEEALGTDEEAVRSLFTDSTSGIARRLYNQIAVYTDSVDGLIKARQDGFDRMIRDTDSQIDRGERRLEDMETSLRDRFAALETLMAQLQGQAASFGSFGLQP